jgi:FtsH ternary system domain X5
VSRAYQVRVSESSVRTVHVEDGVAAQLEMLPILPPARMGDLLAAELAALGFVRDGDACRRTEPDGTEVAVDVAAATVTVKRAAGATIDDQVELGGHATQERIAHEEARLREQARRELDGRAAARTEALRRDLTAGLEAKIAELRRELDGAIGRATIAALTEKAAQLGRIEERHVDDAGNVTIRVRL